MAQNIYRRDTRANLLEITPSRKEIVTIEDTTKHGLMKHGKLRTIAQLLEKDNGIEVRDWDENFGKGVFGVNSFDVSTSILKFGTGASGAYSFASGKDTSASGEGSTVSGDSTVASGKNTVASGKDSIASGDNSVAGGNSSEAIGENSVALGDRVISSGNNSVAVGDRTNTIGDNSLSLGSLTEANGINSFVFGVNSVSDGDNSLSGGNNSNSVGNNSVAVGDNVEARADGSVAFGESTLSSGKNSISIGRGTIASGFNSSAFGELSEASGDNSIASGLPLRIEEIQHTGTREFYPTFADNNYIVRMVPLPDGTVFVLGGWNDTETSSGPSNIAFIHDPVTGANTEVANYPQYIYGGTVFLDDNGDIISLGGFGGVNATLDDSVFESYKYSFENNTWNQLSNMPTPTPSTCYGERMIDGKYLLVGGLIDWDIDDLPAQTWIYDPSNDTYERKADFGAVGVGFAIGGSATDGKMLLFGGYIGSNWDNNENISTYDPVLDTWTHTSVMGTDLEILHITYEDITIQNSSSEILIVKGNRDDLNVMGNIYSLNSDTLDFYKVGNAVATQYSSNKWGISAVKIHNTNSFIFLGYEGNNANPNYNEDFHYFDLVREDIPTKAIGKGSIAFGKSTEAIGDFSSAFGSGTSAQGINSHAEGDASEAGGVNSHAEGINTSALGDNSHAEGSNTEANGLNSHASGDRTIATNDNETVVGKLNDNTIVGTHFVVGIGTYDEKLLQENRMNGLEVYLDGSIYAPELSKTKIDTARSLVTREFVQDKLTLENWSDDFTITNTSVSLYASTIPETDLHANISGVFLGGVLLRPTKYSIFNSGGFKSINIDASVTLNETDWLSIQCVRAYIQD